MKTIPQIDTAFIGGSSTFSLHYPEDLPSFKGEIIRENIVINTPFGESPPFKIFTLDKDIEGKKIITCRMHGWRSGVTRADASRQIFWIFKEAGVRTILAEGGVGAVNHLLNTRDMIIPHDYMDFSMRKDVSLDSKYLLIMREALCPYLREILFKAAGKITSRRIFERGIYVNTDGRHFESPAEINMFVHLKADIVGQSICPEVYLAREIGACYSGIYLVVNFAEGVVKDWEHKELRDIFYDDAVMMGEVILQSLYLLLENKGMEYGCNCADLRKETLLRDGREECQYRGEKEKPQTDL
ncbi:MAG: phosphorylase [Firmicutes bacterium HGW-Firmicutes-13]|nr:MAG: phosphorylase [Firmicutes bacterium HGW-Firmicutes-13]